MSTLLHHVSSRYFRSMAVLILSVLPVAVSTVNAVEPILTKVYVAVGASTVFRDNISAARDQAVSNSLLSAVSRASLDVVLPDAMIQDFDVINRVVYQHAGEFIQNYKVLSVAASPNHYTVMVEATVLIEKIEARLSEVGVLLLKNALPRILFFTTEQENPDSSPKYWWGKESDFRTIFSESMMEMVMREKGFPIVDHEVFNRENLVTSLTYRPELNRQEVIHLGAYFLSDLVVLGKASTTEGGNIMVGDKRSYIATVSARVFNVDSGLEVAATEQKFVAVSRDPAAGVADALSGAGGLAGNDLVVQITEAWQNRFKQLIGIEVSLKWSGNLTHLVEVRRAIAEVPGVKGILPRTMNPEEAVVSVDFNGSGAELADALMRHAFSAFGIHIVEMSESRLSIALSP